jgi:hypothetical protein
MQGLRICGDAQWPRRIRCWLEPKPMQGLRICGAASAIDHAARSAKNQSLCRGLETPAQVGANSIMPRPKIIIPAADLAALSSAECAARHGCSVDAVEARRRETGIRSQPPGVRASARALLDAIRPRLRRMRPEIQQRAADLDAALSGEKRPPSEESC